MKTSVVLATLFFIPSGPSAVAGSLSCKDQAWSLHLGNSCLVGQTISQFKGRITNANYELRKPYEDLYNLMDDPSTVSVVLPNGTHLYRAWRLWERYLASKPRVDFPNPD
jgi:hypothetical protein